MNCGKGAHGRYRKGWKRKSCQKIMVYRHRSSRSEGTSNPVSRVSLFLLRISLPIVDLFQQIAFPGQEAIRKSLRMLPKMGAVPIYS